MNRYLGTEQRKGLLVVAHPVRAGGRFRTAPVRAEDGWTAGRPGTGACVEFTIPNDTTAAAIRFHCVSFARRNAQTRKKETNTQYTTFSNRVSELPLDEAVVEKKKKTALEKAAEALKLAEKNSAAQKRRLLRAANKVQEYDKKAKYYKARIVLLKKQRSGEVRKKKSPKAGDRGFRITRRRRGT
jgi:superfamily II RNA helicase